MRQKIDFEDRYHPATMLLLWKRGGLIQIDGERLYDAFYEILTPVLRKEDFEIYPSTKRNGEGEPCWHIGLRLALWRMREDKHPADGRVRRIGKGRYELTDKGRSWLESYFWSAPLAWLDLEIEELEGGGKIYRYCHPMSGDEMVSFI